MSVVRLNYSIFCGQYKGVDQTGPLTRMILKRGATKLEAIVYKTRPVVVCIAMHRRRTLEDLSTVNLAPIFPLS